MPHSETSSFRPALASAGSEFIVFQAARRRLARALVCRSSKPARKFARSSAFCHYRACPGNPGWRKGLKSGVWMPGTSRGLTKSAASLMNSRILNQGLQTGTEPPTCRIGCRSEDRHPILRLLKWKALAFSPPDWTESLNKGAVWVTAASCKAMPGAWFVHGVGVGG